MFIEQVKIVVRKNFLLSYRTREIFIEMVFPLIVGMAVSLVNFETNKIFLGIPFISFTRSLVFNLINDKAERFKELQKVRIYPCTNPLPIDFHSLTLLFLTQIMGLKTSAYNAGWMISAYIRGFIVRL